MKRWKLTLIASLIMCTILLFAFSNRRITSKRKAPFVPPKGCVFRTIMGEESSALHAVHTTPEKVQLSVNKGLSWIARAQSNNGGWGAGSHSYQQITDPHAVSTDPATTAMVAMALLRSGHTLTTGEFAPQLKKALEHLLTAVESSSPNSNNITTLTGTQIQTKLGANIDVILTSQFLSNVADYVKSNEGLATRVQKCQNICVEKIQNAQSTNGSTTGSGWAGVLQSSFATNALEAAETKGAKVDKKALEKAREFQKNNYDAKTGNVNTDMGAGIVLYSVTGSVRASAKEARKVEEEIAKAKREQKIAQDAPASQETLMDIGYTKDEALKYSTAYGVYQSAKVAAQRDDIMDGFGNNGGEEFLSYLQTGESMIINKDNSWKTWYTNMSGRLLKIQNNDGSWNGHHCITSPVFCTATCLLILSVNNDVDKLMELGKEK
jgi:ribosomal protein L17